MQKRTLMAVAGFFARFIGKSRDPRLASLTLVFDGRGRLVYGILRHPDQIWLSRTVPRRSRPGYIGKTTSCQAHRPQTRRVVT